MSKKEISIMPYSENRMRDALVNSGVATKEGLESYIARTSDANKFYASRISEDGSNLQVDVLNSKYLAPGGDSRKAEKGPLHIWDRVARAISSVESYEHQEHWYQQFMGILADFKFIPGGRIMHGAGRRDARRPPSLSNCYVVPITWTYDKRDIGSLEEILDVTKEEADSIRDTVLHSYWNGITYEEAVKHLQEENLSNDQIARIVFPPDSLEGIYQAIEEMGKIYRSGGGVGTDLSILRPEGMSVNSTIRNTPGVTAFMELFGTNTKSVSQSGRRGALMLTIDVHHPDVERFIGIKNDPKRKNVQDANISVKLTDEFMKAVINDKEYTQRWATSDIVSPLYKKKDGTLERKVKARYIWNMIIENAHVSGEPGILFWDAMKAFHNVEYANPLVGTNPCGEEPLAAYTSCNLGNINLVKFVKKDGGFNFEGLARTTKVAVRFLDDVIDYNDGNHALRKISESVRSDRRVGVGVTGLADGLVLMKLKYDSNDALKKVEEIMQTIRDIAYKTSIELAEEKGTFPLFDKEKIFWSRFIQCLPGEIQEGIKAKGLRNSTILTVPPVGTGSIIAEGSSGIEPIFCTSYKRRVKQPDGTTYLEYKIYHPLIKDKFGDDTNLPNYVVTAHQIDPRFRVKMQGVIQKYVDASISSTINLPENIPIKTVADIYIMAYKEGLKGITVYREGSREGILQTGEHAKDDNKIHPRKRPAITSGVTERIKTSEGNMYITINKDGVGLIEFFVSVGKAGGDPAAQSEAVARLGSLILRVGVDPWEIVHELKGIRGPAPIWENGEQILSTPDAVGRVLERYLIREGYEDPDKLKKEPNKESDLEQKIKDEKDDTIFDICPKCNEKTFKHEGSCGSCGSCGYSRC